MTCTPARNTSFKKYSKGSILSKYPIWILTWEGKTHLRAWWHPQPALLPEVSHFYCGVQVTVISWEDVCSVILLTYIGQSSWRLYMIKLLRVTLVYKIMYVGKTWENIYSYNGILNISREIIYMMYSDLPKYYGGEVKGYNIQRFL